MSIGEENEKCAIINFLDKCYSLATTPSVRLESFVSPSSTEGEDPSSDGPKSVLESFTNTHDWYKNATWR